MSKIEKQKEIKLKFKVIETGTVYTVLGKEGTIVLNDKATQKELGYVYDNVVNGLDLVMKVPA